MELDDHNTDASTIAELAMLAEENLPAQIITLPDGRTFGLHRNDVLMTQITPENAAEVFAPKTIKLTTQLQTSTALAQYLHRFMDDDSIMFADVHASKITAIVDYHKRPTANVIMGRDAVPQDANAGVPASAGAVPRHSAHRAVLQLRHSQEWDAWTAMAKRGLVSHTDFIDFLEENSFDITKPDRIAMVENCRDMRGAETGSFTSSVRAGAMQKFEYRQDNTVQSTEFPMEFTVTFPIYFGGQLADFKVMTRYLYKSGELRLGIKILRLERERQDAFTAITAEIESATGVEAILGNPA